MARKSKVLSKSKAPKDFAKVKNKVGKKKQEKANEMKTDFKVKKVQMPAQNALEEKGEEVTHRKLGLGELLAHLQHHSSKVRRDALRGLLELCRDHPGVLSVNLSQILDSISLSASDGSADVRGALRSLQAYILDAMPSEALGAFGATLALQVRSAISHVSGEVREDGLKLLELYLLRLGSKQVLTQGEAGRLVGTLCQLHSHVDLVLPCLLQLLSSQTSRMEADEDALMPAQLSLQDVLEGKLRATAHVPTNSEAADNEIWDFCLRAWMQAGDMPRSASDVRAAKPGWMRLRVAAVLEQGLVEVLASSGAQRPTATQVATLSGIVRRGEWPIHVDEGSALRPLADSINLRMARVLALLVAGAAPSDAAPKHLQRLALAALSVAEAVLSSCVTSFAAHAAKLPGGSGAAAAAAAQALEASPSKTGTDEVKPFTTVGAVCHGLRVLDLLWRCVTDTDHFSAADIQQLTRTTAAVASGTGRSDGEFLPSTAALLAVPLTASLLNLPSAADLPAALQRAAPNRRRAPHLAQVIEEARPGTLANWVTSWPKMLWYLGAAHPKLSLFLMASILKLGKAAESGSVHAQLLSAVLPLLVPFIAGMPGDESPPPLAKLKGEDALQRMAAAMLFHFPRLKVSLIQLLSASLCRWAAAAQPAGADALGDGCCEVILEAMLSGQTYSNPQDEMLVCRLQASLAVLQMAPQDELRALKLVEVIAAWVMEHLGAKYPLGDGPVTGLSLDQRRHLAMRHVAWPLCRQLLGSKDPAMARRALCFLYLCARRLSGTSGGEVVSDDISFLKEVFGTLVAEDALTASPVLTAFAERRGLPREEPRAGAGLFVSLWMHLAPFPCVAYELLLQLCVQQLLAGPTPAGSPVPWVLVEAVTYRNAHGLSIDSWGRLPLGLAPLSREQLRQKLPQLELASAREHVLALLPLL